MASEGPMEGLDKLLTLMEGAGSVLVAFSGGVDSTLVAYAARKALGRKAAAVMYVNETVPRKEVEEAEAVASELDIPFRTLAVDVLSSREFSRNGRDRCGICHGLSIPPLLQIAKEMEMAKVADGANVDDLGDHRPGLKVSNDLGIWHPLMEVGIGKAEVRAILKEVGISIHDKPSSPCLASRIPYGEPITAGKLRIVEEIEEGIRKLGFEQVRLRLHEGRDGALLGIVEVEDPNKALRSWDELLKTGKGLKMSLDPLGYRQGSLNHPIAHP